ncbi:MAG: DUF421 domain-containing protein [Ilumatobacter sp.]|nr:DUF421 domain-containing protein [Ilumatobacter sp.]
MAADWLWTSWSAAWLLVLSSIAALIVVIAAIRITGLRSLSKMSSFDFAVTVAIGSILASVAATSTSLANGAIAVGTLLTAQAVIALLRQRSFLAGRIDNQPLLLMRDGEFIEHALHRSRVTENDVLAKLRAANVTELSQVSAVVLETTGDVSVLHGDGPLADDLLRDVKDARASR